MNLDDFQALALPTTGLVPMVILAESVDQHQQGDVAGFQPDAAFRLFAARRAAVYNPATGETLASDGKPAAVSAPAAPAAYDVEIPDDWQSLHHIRLIALAAKITGDKVASKDEAIAIIERELTARAGESE
ncbi:hypothetical protein ACUSIJ_07630 [Pseudochelatococcus sp. B33]